MTGFANTVANIFTPQGFIGFVEFLIFIVMLFYTFFAFLLTRQLRLMNRSFTTPIAAVLTLIGLAHLLGSAFLTFLAYIVI